LEGFRVSEIKLGIWKWNGPEGWLAEVIFVSPKAVVAVIDGEPQIHSKAYFEFHFTKET